MKKIIKLTISGGLCFLSTFSFAQGGTIISPGSTVGQYEKIEFGVNPGATIQASINTFFGNDPAGNAGYGHAFNSSGINPYNPDQISVEATFKFLGTPAIPDQLIYGFYYRDYGYKEGTSDISETSVTATSTWKEKIINNHWRVRFAPKYTGNWQVTFRYRQNNGTSVTLGSVVNFTCGASNNKGFLKFGANNKFMVYSNGESAFLAGVCEGWPKPEQYDGDNGKFRPKEYTDHRAVVKKIADGGGNYTKIVFCPYSYGFEWEKLNIYDANPSFALDNNPYGTNRQSLMWEFDRMLDMARANNLYIHLCMEMGEGYFNNGNLSWVNNPYNTGLSDINYMNDFFDINKSAVNTYKKRIRYMIARWGYSTNISAFEILNEVETMSSGYTMSSDYIIIKDPNNPNYIDPDYDLKLQKNGILFSNWHDAISTYIRNGIGDKNHLICGSYGWYNLGNPSDHSWSIGAKTNIDFLNRHPYAWDRNKATGMWKDVAYMTDPAIGGYGKPTFITEFGHSLFGCGAAVDLNADSPEFHNGLWTSSFTGSPVAGLEWWDMGIDNYMPHIVTLRNFFSGINLDASNFVSRRFPEPEPTGPNDLLEAYMLVNNNGTNVTEVIGWAHNKSNYWRNLIVPPASGGCTNYYSASLAAAVTHPDCGDVFAKMIDDSYNCPQEGQLGNITILNVVPNTNFAIEWYSTTSGVMVRSDLATSTSGSVLTITPPAMVKGAHDYSYRIRVFNGGFCNSNDILAIANVNDVSGKKSLLLNNRCNQANGAIRTINMSNNNENIVWHGADRFNGWMDSGDKLFIGNVTGDNEDEAVMVNTSYSYGAIATVNIKTGAYISVISHGTFTSWMDPTDKMFLGDVDGDGKSDLVLVNTSMSGGAIRAINLMTGANISTPINHGTFSTWMDATDQMFLADVNGDNKKDLVMVNTSTSTGGAIRAVNIMTGANVYTPIDHSIGFGGWFDTTDKLFMGDVNGDNKEDLVQVNTSYNSGAIRVTNISDGGNLFWISHNSPTSQFLYWMDSTDKMLLEDVNGDNKKDLIFANSDYVHGYLRAYNISTASDIGQLNTGGPYTGWFDCNDRILVGDLTGNGNKDIIMVNADYSNAAFLVSDISTSPNSPIVKWHSNYTNPSLTTWKDGIDDNSMYSCTARLATDVIEDESNREISVYPNPSKGIINITGIQSGMQINVYNSLGSKVISRVADNQTTLLDCSSLQNGIYFIEISNGKTTLHSKILIEK